MRDIKEKLMKGVFLAAALASIAAVSLICVFLFANGVPAIGKIGLFNFLLGKSWNPGDVPPSYGILPMIMGSIYVTAGAIAVGVPIGLLTSVFMAFYCPARLYRILKPAISLLAGIPSVVYGFFGLTVVIPIVREIFGGSGSSILTASLLLGIMILPTVIGVSLPLFGIPRGDGIRKTGRAGVLFSIHQADEFLPGAPEKIWTVNTGKTR
jgi:phosphate transport system permease protein